ncbi:hypothetical protein Pcinc_022337, partial [Petrolisthes cinctipes]
YTHTFGLTSLVTVLAAGQVTSDSEPHLTLVINTGPRLWCILTSTSHFFTSEFLLLLTINNGPRLWCILTLPATSLLQSSFYQWPSTIQFLDFSACRSQSSSSSTSLPQTFFLHWPSSVPRLYCLLTSTSHFFNPNTIPSSAITNIRQLRCLQTSTIFSGPHTACSIRLSTSLVIHL